MVRAARSRRGPAPSIPGTSMTNLLPRSRGLPTSAFDGTITGGMIRKSETASRCWRGGEGVAVLHPPSENCVVSFCRRGSRGLDSDERGRARRARKGSGTSVAGRSSPLDHEYGSEGYASRVDERTRQCGHSARCSGLSKSGSASLYPQ
jgi:hypothetical protein